MKWTYLVLGLLTAIPVICSRLSYPSPSRRLPSPSLLLITLLSCLLGWPVMLLGLLVSDREGAEARAARRMAAAILAAAGAWAMWLLVRGGE